MSGLWGPGDAGGGRWVWSIGLRQAATDVLHHYLPAKAKDIYVNLGQSAFIFSQLWGDGGSLGPVILCLVQSHYSFKWRLVQRGGLIYLQGVINNADVSWNYWVGSCSLLSKMCHSSKPSVHYANTLGSFFFLLPSIFLFSELKAEKIYHSATVGRDS